MFSTPAKLTVARKQHQCTYCAEQIDVGEAYQNWKSVDDSWFTNKVHVECYEALWDDTEYGQFEYTAYSGERPKK